MISPTLYLVLLHLYFAQGDALAPGLAATYRDANHIVREVVATPNFYVAAGKSVHPRKGRVPLDGLGSKSGVGALAAYLREPSRFDPGGRMPLLLLTDEEAVQV